MEVCILNYVGPNRCADYLVYPPVLYNLPLDVYNLSIFDYLSYTIPSIKKDPNRPWWWRKDLDLRVRETRRRQ